MKDNWSVCKKQNAYQFPNSSWARYSLVVTQGSVGLILYIHQWRGTRWGHGKRWGWSVFCPPPNIKVAGQLILGTFSFCFMHGF